MRKKLIILIAACAFFIQGCRGAESQAEKEIEAVDGYRAAYISRPLKIDGRLDEPAWEKADILEFVVSRENTEPISRTKGRVLWDDEYLYVGFEAKDKDVWGYFQERNDPTCLEDVLEIFFNTNPENSAYYNFEINALGTVYDAFTPRSIGFAGGTRRWKQWNCEGLKVGIQIHGTLNDWRDVDEGWDMEVAIPFKSLETIGGKAPECGDVWRFHLARYDYSVHLPGIGREISSTVPFYGERAGFHDQETWMPLIFIKSGE